MEENLDIRFLNAILHAEHEGRRVRLEAESKGLAAIKKAEEKTKGMDKNLIQEHESMCELLEADIEYERLRRGAEAESRRIKASAIRKIWKELKDERALSRELSSMRELHEKNIKFRNMQYDLELECDKMRRKAVRDGNDMLRITGGDALPLVEKQALILRINVENEAAKMRDELNEFYKH